MDSSKQPPIVSVEEAVLKAKVAQICHSVGYNAITQDSSNVLVDIYRRTILHLARHCKDAANNNRRVEPTLVDLVQAYDFVGISIPELQEHIETVKIPLNIELIQDEQKPSNRIQRNLLVDDLLEAEKNSHLEEQEDGDNKALSENGLDEDEKPTVPLLRDTYEEISSKFANSTPVSADKKIIFLLAKTKLKIAPILPEPTPTTSGAVGKLGKKKKKKEVEKKKTSESVVAPATPVKTVRGRGKKRKKLSREFVLTEPSPEKELEPPVEERGPVEEEPPRKIEDEPVEETPEEPTQELLPKLELETEKPKEKEKVKDRGKEKVKGSKKNSNKKNKISVVTPLDPAIAEPPSFFPIIDVKPEPIAPIVEPSPPLPAATPTPPPKFSIVVATSSNAQDENCPECGLPDDGTLMIQCDDPDCARWFHGKCVSLLEEPKEDESWSCKTCVEKQQSSFKRTTDGVTGKLGKKKKKKEVEKKNTPDIAVAPATPVKAAQGRGKKRKKLSREFVDTELSPEKELKPSVEERVPVEEEAPQKIEEEPVDKPVEELVPKLEPGIEKPKEKEKVKDRGKEKLKSSKKNSNKKSKTSIVAPLDPTIAEPPSFFPIIDVKPEPIAPIVEPSPPLPAATPTPPPKFSIVVATSSNAQDENCPECGLPDDGTLMIQCDDPDCARWFHGKCVSLLEEPKEDESWFCKACVEKQQSAFKRRRRPK